MDIDPALIWTAMLTVVIGPMAWVFRSTMTELKEAKDLLRLTREQYVSKQDLQSDLAAIDKKLDRLEGLLIKVIGNLKLE
tara:strand:- start:143 stop:382 length:240 start_codon:yes stop_codon:yes gene_type:complete